MIQVASSAPSTSPAKGRRRLKWFGMLKAMTCREVEASQFEQLKLKMATPSERFSDLTDDSSLLRGRLDQSEPIQNCEAARGRGFAYVYLVKEVVSDGDADHSEISKKKFKNSDNVTYALKKIFIQSEEQLALVKEEIHVSSLFSHPNLLPLLDHAIIAVKGAQEGIWNYEAYLLFPVHLDGTLFDIAKLMQSKKEFYSPLTVLQIFGQICAGLKHMHSFTPPYAHNDVKPGNILVTHRSGQLPLAILMDFGSTRPAKWEIRSRSEALQLQEWAAEHCSAPFRAPELWDCPSHADIDSKTDIWALGCTLFAIMYGVSPFEYALDSGGSLQLAIMNAQVKWPSGPNPPYPESLHQFVTWMLHPQPAIRPYIDDIITHVDNCLFWRTVVIRDSEGLFKWAFF
ncbi:hypothetical protein HPP92_015560 [Vanilla planifolia]|uniref:non-specific serine/threonine protein kinase n=1 Tax=Vanilla planifolia TaxID=51239 RepID=A0A835QSD9_VANPL|nr:hypothetical protein HPP92_015560 [Vanilla planifolia]